LLQGGGTALLKATAAVAAERGAARLQWQALPWNQKAIDFYSGPAVRCFTCHGFSTHSHYTSCAPSGTFQRQCTFVYSAVAGTTMEPKGNRFLLRSSGVLFHLA